MLVDSHSHLYFQLFDEDRFEVMERARAADLDRILIPGIDLPTSRQAIRLSEIYPECYAALGIHPNDAKDWTESSLDELRSLAGHPKVVAIGEIGLDYYRDQTAHALQKRVFHQQLLLAAEFGLPVVVHIRNASTHDTSAVEDTLGELIAWQKRLTESNPALSERPGVLHSFSSDLKFAKLAVECNFMIGISGPITFKNAETLRSVVRGLPLNHILIETDAPFLTPDPFRGKRNEPSYVKYVAEKIAQVQTHSLDKVAQTTTSNAERLFCW